MEKKQLSINLEKWEKAKDWGWGVSSIEQPVYKEEYKPEEYQKLVRDFVQRRLPAICGVFYDSVNDGLVGAGLNVDHAIEMTEEILVFSLDEILINMAQEICPELLETK